MGLKYTIEQALAAARKKTAYFNGFTYKCKGKIRFFASHQHINTYDTTQ